ncbi:MAG: DUF885 domain-containing protein [bacterium]|nr:DUF885 domain-containing protein [bacterium]
MKTACLLAIVALAVLPGCSSGPAADEEFVGLADRYLDKMLEMIPEWATSLGDHRFDHLTTDMSAAGHVEYMDFCRAYLDSLEAIDLAELSTVNRIDCEILRDVLARDIFLIEELREYTWNPTWYNAGDGIYNLVARDFAPLEERLEAVLSRLEQIPALLAAARENLDAPPAVMTRTAIDRNRGVVNMIMDGLNEYLDQVPGMRERFAGPRAAAIAALEEHGTWLEDDLLPRSTGDFRIGCERFEQKLRFALASDLSAAEIQSAAARALVEMRRQMYEVAAPLYISYGLGDLEAAPGEDHVIRTVLDRLAEDRPTNETIVEEAREGLAHLTDWMREADIMTVPDEPVEIIVMPEHQRGFSIAYCDSPGPLEEGGTTFYAISPTPAHWTPERAETFYREYNDWMLLNLSVHEAMPGHYLQIAHANAFEAPTPLRAIFGSGTFVEGWATYAEQLMVEMQYAGPELQMQQLKMSLRLIINAIIDYRIHCEGMSEDEAMQMMMVEGFQEEAEAAGKWVRAQLSSTQLSTYYVGNLEINGIRRDYEARAGAGFDLKTFHDTMLSFGSPAPKYVRELMGLD